MPARLIGTVKKSLRYIASGSSVFSPSPKATEGEVGRDDEVELGEGGGEVGGDLGPHLLRLAVVGVVVAGGERVGAEHDPPLDLGAEALGPGLLVHLDHVAARLRPHPVADAVVAGEVRGGLGRGDHVVGGDPVLGVGQADLGDLAAELLDLRQRRLEDLAHAGLDRIAGQVARDAEAQPVEVLAVGQARRLGQPDRGRVAGILRPAGSPASGRRR